ncbi:MAG TPA: GAF domain-containing sensor histidine kinase [Candidatus Dormibacteraeota bacterium]|nr:GAF domain-containing sensor histidine kinase [Candidatus Dormibacteraeota bacterium]
MSVHSAEGDLLRRILATVSQGLDLEATVRDLAGLIAEVTNTDACFVHVLDDERRRLTLAGATPPFDVLAGQIELNVGEGVAGWVAQHGRPAVVDDKWSDARYKYIPELRGEDFQALVSVPMTTARGVLVGVLNVHSRRPQSFSDADVNLLTHVAGLIAGVVENARLYRRLEEHEAELERFARHTLQLQESERKRMAGDVHDGISQRLVSLHYHLCAAADTEPPPDPAVSHQLAVARDLAAAALEEARGVIEGLRPPMLDDLGLGACLNGLARDLAPGLVTSVEVDESDVLDPDLETALYRIAQEALQNVVRHAGARHVDIQLRVIDGTVRLRIEDDGRGFDVDELERDARAASHGLAGLRARAELVGAALEVVSAAGDGTRIVVTAPVSAPG